MIIIRVPENYILVISQPAARSSSYDTVAEREVEQSGAEREIDGETVGIMRSFRGLKRHENPKRRRDDGKWGGFLATRPAKNEKVVPSS